ncbi:hypothetical protein AAVH_42762, partial [Aphelenchoides avenae]
CVNKEGWHQSKCPKEKDLVSDERTCVFDREEDRCLSGTKCQHKCVNVEGRY